MICYQELASQTSSTFLHGSHWKPRPKATQNAQCQEAHMLDTTGRTPGGCGKGRRSDKDMPEMNVHYCTRLRPQGLFCMVSV